MNSKKAELADLYYRSQSFRLGRFRFSVHVDNPDLELSPQYLHYPKDGEPGSELLPVMFELITDLFYEILLSVQPPLRLTRIAGVPAGALPLAKLLAKRVNGWPNNLLTFDKIERPGETIFIGPDGVYLPGDELLILDDHTSGGRNKRLIKVAAEKAGLVVRDMLTVVDRQQGGFESMASQGVRLLSILTLDELLDHGLANGYINQDQVDTVRSYVARNQLWTPADS